ncbi:MAG: alcohol dehydrogenase catalytic domain-containing protein [Armatimonadetes bacterium]|nr:alcohol dehydrogenase catalytic domain-containing protein [Armatimonadota bacterium]MDW8153801.1 alcohol dehydrogenase catalytic domain-containing protein [Armatimonadota bacterium]
MRALIFHPTVPRYLATRILGRFARRAYWSALSPLSLREIPEPPLPGPEWVKVRTLLGGICGSDLHLLRLDVSPYASAFTSFPFVPGHENVGIVVEVGSAVRGVEPGQRVVVEPTLPCAARGLGPCRFCRGGDYHLCERTQEGELGPGLLIGACRDTGGSWGEFFVAHRSQIFRVPDSVSDENALLVEPMASALHPLLRHPPQDHHTVLVIGGGIIGQLVVAGLRAMHSRARVILLAKYPFQAEASKRLGADHTVLVGRGDRHYEAVAELTGGRLIRPMFGRRVLLGGGADWVAECTGTERALDDALRLARPGGTVIPLGLPAIPRTVDWTPLWLKELRVVGSYTYAWESWGGQRRRTLEIVLEWMAGGQVDLGFLVTHTFPLEQFPRAFQVAMAKAETAAFKVAFGFGAG